MFWIFENGTSAENVVAALVAHLHVSCVCLDLRMDGELGRVGFLL